MKKKNDWTQKDQERLDELEIKFRDNSPSLDPEYKELMILQIRKVSWKEEKARQQAS